MTARTNTGQLARATSSSGVRLDVADTRMSFALPFRPSS